MGPLSEQETQDYIHHRLKVANSANDIFTEDAVRLIYENSGGIPRRINQICDLSLLCGYNKNSENINIDIVNEAISSIWE